MVMSEDKKTEQKDLDRQLKGTFPASDPLSKTQPKKEGAGAPKNRTSVNSGIERKLAEEIELNDTKKQAP